MLTMHFNLLSALSLSLFLRVGQLPRLRTVSSRRGNFLEQNNVRGRSIPLIEFPELLERII